MSSSQGPLNKTSGAAAAHYGPTARKLLMELFPSTEEFDSFCVDYYLTIYRRFTSGMDRISKENILLSSRGAYDVILKLKESCQDNHRDLCIIEHHLCELNNLSTASKNASEDIRFSESIINKISKLQETVNSLTLEQYRVIEFLRGHRRVAITGCAGSGKTLVAAEKSIRLAKAGISTLVLCHNPLLADRLRELVRGSGAHVFDFENWIRHILQQDQVASGPWSNYAEPTEHDISAAFCTLADPAHRYDAIIVDEGQDFRELWWVVVEAALRDEKNSILYVFYDEKQSLLPYRGSPKLLQSPFFLSKNCRNAGRIYDIIRRYDERAPEPAPQLATLGVVRSSVCPPRGERQMVSDAVLQALNELPISSLIVLTAEPTPIDQSTLNDVYISLAPSWSWQDIVSAYLTSVMSSSSLLRTQYFPQPIPAQKKNYRVYIDEQIPKLGSGLYPSPADIAAVSEWAQKAGERMRHVAMDLERRDKPAIEGRTRWMVVGDRLYLSGRMSPEKVIDFFRDPSWADDLPKPRQVRIAARPSPGSQGEEIPLYNVAGFKGLEADGVIYYEPAGLTALSPLRYVGISRARWLLHLVVTIP